MRRREPGPPSKTPRVADVTSAFLAMEEELGLLESTIHGVRFWERARFPVYRRAQASQRFPKVSHATTESWLTRWAKIASNTLRSLTTRDPARAGPTEVLFVGHPRRARTPAGRWKDLYCDPLMGSLDRSTMLVEHPFQDGHKRPTVTEEIYYLDRIWQAHRLKRTISPLEGEEARLVEDLKEALSSRFGFEGPIRHVIEHVLKVHNARTPLYERLLDKLQPDVIVLVVSYVMEELIEVAQRRDIPVVELQHGLLHPHHMGYHYPGDRTKEAFPDYVFTWGPNWNDRAALPIPDENVIATGYAHLTDERDAFQGVEKQDRIIFISQPGAGRALSKLAVDLEGQTRYEVVYKVHPSEVNDWPTRYPWLEASNVSVQEEGLHEVLASSKVQVGHSSTVLFEGLAYGLRTLILDAPGHQAASSVLENAGASLVKTTDDIEEALDGSNVPASSVDAWFARDPRRRFKEALAEVLEAS